VFPREINAEYRGIRIAVQNSWGNGIVAALISEGIGGARRALGDETKLLVNGQIIDSTKAWILSPRSTLLLQASIDGDNGKHTVTIYAKSALLKNLLKICVDGERIAGDEF
jgi:hypothetical protein